MNVFKKKMTECNRITQDMCGLMNSIPRIISILSQQQTC